MEWEKDLIQRVEMDMQYQEQLEEVRKKEEVFQEIRNLMPMRHREIIDDYISACEELDHIMIRVAYTFGRETGENIRYLYRKGKNRPVQ